MKDGLESKQMKILMKIQKLVNVPVLLPVRRGSLVLFDFKLGRGSLASWRMKISQEECSRITQRTVGEMTYFSFFVELSKGSNCSSRKESRRTVKSLIRRRKKQLFDDKKKKRKRKSKRQKRSRFLVYSILTGYLERVKGRAKERKSKYHWKRNNIT